MKVKLLIMTLLFGLCLSQDFNQMNKNPIQGFTSTPNIDKMSISADYSYLGARKFFDGDGKIWKDGESISIADTLKFDFRQNTLNINLNYLGVQNVGVYLKAPITFNREINSVSVGESGLGDLSFGIYFLWDQYFKTQRIKTGAFYKRAKSGLPGDFSVLHTGTGQNNIGFDAAMDIFISEKIILSLKQVTTFNGQTTYSISTTEDSISIKPSTSFDFKARGIYNFTPQLSLGFDYTYQSFASILENFTQSTGFISGIKPLVGYKLFSGLSLGYLNIESLNIIGSWSIILDGKFYYKPNIFQLGTQIYFN